VEDDLAKAVARKIQLRLTSEQLAELSRSRPVNPEAFDAYLRGYYFFQRKTNQSRTASEALAQRPTIRRFAEEAQPAELKFR
jgi:hypothetical protein